MNRTLLMSLLALDIVVMGVSGFMLWDRYQKKAAAQASQRVVQPPAPAQQSAPTPEAPASAAPASASTQTVAVASETAPATAVSAAPVRPGRKKSVTFRYRDSVPERVSVVGDFNQWSPQLMRRVDRSNWSLTIKVAPGSYAYNFIVDGQMIRDPSNKRVQRAGQKIPSSLLVIR